MIEASSSAGLISGFSISSQVQIGHLQRFLIFFLGMTLLFVVIMIEQILNLHCILIWFQLVSGLRVNFTKSSILPVGHLDNIHLLAGVLGCNIDAFPITYLGLPLGANLCRKLFGILLLGNLRKDFQVGSLLIFQKGGNNSHQECSLQHSHFFLSLFPLPASMTNNLEAIQRNFLWGSLSCKMECC